MYYSFRIDTASIIAANQAYCYIEPTYSKCRGSVLHIHIETYSFAASSARIFPSPWVPCDKGIYGILLISVKTECLITENLIISSYAAASKPHRRSGEHQVLTDMAEVDQRNAMRKRTVSPLGSVCDTG